MNQTFSFQRWTLLVAKHWAENRKRYLLSIVAFMSLILVWYVFVMLTDDQHPMAEGIQWVTFYFSLAVVGPFYASQFFKSLGSKSKAVDYLMVPASALEKTITGIFYAVILFPLIFIASFYFVDAIAVAGANLFHPSYNTEGAKHAQIANIFDLRNPRINLAFYWFLLLVGVQSAFLLGSVYFAQYSYIKTAISLSLAFLIIAFVGLYIPLQWMPRGAFHDSPIQYTIHSGNWEDRKMVALPGWIGKVLEYIFLYAFHPIFWITTYFRLKEKEV
jgi:hypothetical protein